LTPLGCNGTALTAFFAAGGSLSAHFSVSVDRFASLILNYDLSYGAYFACYFLIFGILVIIAIFQVLGSGFVPMETYSWCFLPLTSTDRRDEILSILTLTVCLSVTTVVVLVYVLIYFKTIRIPKDVRSAQRESVASTNILRPLKDRPNTITLKDQPNTISLKEM
jgi:hypothetical protein